MTRNDWIGIGASVALHALLLLIVTAATPPVEPAEEIIGTIAVEFGPVELGKKAPPQPKAVEQPRVEQRPARRPQPERPQQPRRQPATNPVKAPEAVTNSQERIASTQQQDGPPSTAAERSQRQEAASPPAAQPGTGDQTSSRSPFSIEGLNRTAIRLPEPRNSAGTVATIRVEIVVAPDGSVTFGRWLQKGNATLEREVLDAIRRWRFNALPGRAPQVDQRGSVTFRFTV